MLKQVQHDSFLVLLPTKTDKKVQSNHIIIKSLLPKGKRLLKSETERLSWPVRIKRVYVFCYRVFNSLQKHSALCSQVARTLARRRLAEFSSLFHDHKQRSWYLKVSAPLFKIRKRRDSNSRCRLPHTTP